MHKKKGKKRESLLVKLISILAPRWVWSVNTKSSEYHLTDGQRRALELLGTGKVHQFGDKFLETGSVKGEEKRERERNFVRTVLFWTSRNVWDRKQRVWGEKVNVCICRYVQFYRCGRVYKGERNTKYFPQLIILQNNQQMPLHDNRCQSHNLTNLMYKKLLAMFTC